MTEKEELIQIIKEHPEICEVLVDMLVSIAEQEENK